MQIPASSRMRERGMGTLSAGRMLTVTVMRPAATIIGVR
jgi:hypothetical protein